MAVLHRPFWSKYGPLSSYFLEACGLVVRDHSIAPIGEFTDVRFAIELAEHILLDPNVQDSV